MIHRQVHVSVSLEGEERSTSLDVLSQGGRFAFVSQHQCQVHGRSLVLNRSNYRVRTQICISSGHLRLKIRIQETID